MTPFSTFECAPCLNGAFNPLKKKNSIWKFEAVDLPSLVCAST